jgi:hypothetical protein
MHRLLLHSQMSLRSTSAFFVLQLACCLIKRIVLWFHITLGFGDSVYNNPRFISNERCQILWSRPRACVQRRGIIRFEVSFGVNG